MTTPNDPPTENAVRLSAEDRMKPNYYAQAESLLESHKAGRVSWTQVVEVMKSIPWGQTAPTGDYFTSADVPVMNGPSLTAMLGVAKWKGLIGEGQADALTAILKSP